MTARRVRAAVAVMALVTLWPAVPASAQATISIVNVDAPGVGFNDPTPAAPVGGNPGTTVGEQRLIAFQFAADLWGMLLDSDVEIRVQASFPPLFCTPTQGVLGAAGPIAVATDFPGARFTGTWHVIALANKRAGMDLIPDDPGTGGDDVVAFFNSLIDDPECLGETRWYYGLDTEHGTDINLVTVLLHELAHGLGFISLIDEETGEQFLDQPDVFSRFGFDTTTGRRWTGMTDAERAASAINARQVVWNGLATTLFSSRFLERGYPELVVRAPEPIAGSYEIGTAAFGPPLDVAGVSGVVALAEDGVDVGTDACEPIQSDVAGRIALIDRGTCNFTIKVANAQAAGAIAALIADSEPGAPPPGLGGDDPTIMIPSARITLADGAAIKDALAEDVLVKLRLDRNRLSGTDRLRRVQLFTPNPAQPGSSLSHWDPLASPNLLMEPAINADLPLDVDLTLPQFWDIGWLRAEDCRRGGWQRFPQFFRNQGACLGLAVLENLPARSGRMPTTGTQ